MQTFEFTVEGMDCAECAAHVEKALAELPHINSAQVLLGAEKAIIQYTNDLPQQEAISRAITDAGYEAVFDPIKETANGDETINQFSIRFFILIVILVLGISIAGETLGFFDIIQDFIPWYIWLALILLGGWPIFRNVLQSLLKKRIISHTLMSASVITAAALGEWLTAVLIVFFMRFGDLIERKTTDSARQSVRKLGNLVPKTARVLVEGEEIEITISELNPGDVIVVRPGESIPADGIVIEGHASVDQSSITGESFPFEIGAGKQVTAASILITGMLVIQATAVGRETTFGKIIQMVEEAEAARGNVQRYADRFSGYYLPIVALTALITFFIRRDLTAAASVMVVACSCSFSLATPVAMLASIGASAQNGLLFKGGKYVEMLSAVDTIFIDKTGTLTIGQPVITDVIPKMEIPERELLQYCASAERYSEHPLAEAVLRKAVTDGVPLLPVKDFNNIPGKGVSAEINGRKVLVENSPAHHTEDYSTAYTHLREEGKTLLFVHIDGEDAGILAAEDVLREDAALAIDALRKTGIKHLKLISGDHHAAVKKVAEKLEIDFSGGMSPEDKIAAIKERQSNGHLVAMIGDGINDAPALAQADIGISMGKTGSDIAVETSDIILLRENWMLVPEAVDTAKKTMRVVRMNILFTAIYNLVGLSLAAAGLLPPAIAAAMQSIPDVGIMANSARLLRQRGQN